MWENRKLRRVALVFSLLFCIGALVACNGNTAELEARVQTAEAKADAAQQTAETALAQSQAVQATTQPSRDHSLRHFLGGGINLNYQNNGALETINYPVDRMKIFANLEEIPANWFTSPEVTVQLGWIGTDGSDTLELYFADRQLSEEPPLNLSAMQPTSWHEYVLFAEITPGDSDQHGSANLQVEKGPENTTTSVLLSQVDESTENIPLFHLLDSLSEEKILSQVLLTMSTPEGDYSENWLVVLWEPTAELGGIDPGPDGPAGGDPLGRRQCLRCVFGYCRLACWFWRWR